MFGPPDIEKLSAKHDIKGLLKVLAASKTTEKWRAAKINAATALGLLGDSSAVEPLIAALSQLPKGYGPLGYGHAIPERKAIVKALGQLGDSRAVEPLITQLDDDPIQKDVVEVLGQLRDSRAVEPLITLLSSIKADNELASGWNLAKVVAETLCKIGDPCAIDLLVPLLQSKFRAVRKGAAMVLQNMNSMDDDRRAALAVANRNWDEAVSLGSAAVEPLIGILVDFTLTNHDYGETEAAAKALGKIGDARAIEPLTAMLRAKTPAVRESAFKALEGLGAINDTQRAVRAVANHNWDEAVSLGSAAVEPLIGVFADNNAEVRKSAAEAILKLADEQAIKLLIRVLRDQNINARQTAAEVLGKLGDSRAFDPLILAFNDANPHGDWGGGRVFSIEKSKEREIIVSALIRLGDPRAARPLAAALWEEKHIASSWFYRDMREEPLQKPQRALLAVVYQQFEDARDLGASAIKPLIEVSSFWQKGQAVVDALQQILEKEANEIDADDLRALVGLQNVTQTYVREYGDEHGDVEWREQVNKDVDTSLLKQLARQELKRRGLEDS